MNSFIKKRINRSNLERLSLGWKYVLGLSVFLLFTSDLFNYLNNVWEKFPSQYYVFWCHLFSIPLFIGLILLNRWFLNREHYADKKEIYYVIIFNLISFLPIIATYYYWDLADYQSNGVYLIYIFIFSFLLRLPKFENGIMFAYFALVYFLMLSQFSISYMTNPSLYLNGLASLFICYGINRALYNMEIKRNEQWWKIHEKNREIQLLNAQLHENYVTIKRQNKNISAINVGLENFAGIAAHDVKAPLCTIHSYIQLIADKYRHILTEEELNYQKILLKTSENLSNLVESLFQLSKDNHLANKVKTIDVNELIEEVILMLDSRIKEKNAVIEFEKNIPPVLGIKQLTQHLVLNILSNALKFSKPNTDPHIQINYKPCSEGVIIEIKDNGIGIPKKYQDEIFNIFYRLDNSNIYEGNGIGLGNSKKIMKLQSGEIWVESEFGKGSSFFLQFQKGVLEEIEKPKDELSWFKNS